VQPFLTADWRYLAMLNYVVDPRLIAPLVPSGTEIDFENGETFLSVVGFLFLDTRLVGVPIPLHRDFEEVNLRFLCAEKIGGHMAARPGFHPGTCAALRDRARSAGVLRRELFCRPDEA
jgi:uncharacterized protein YqjF (DUF2071 family)